ncbi:MAG: hypothetical protein H0U23_09915 [Blastocatellia bacterium]|nr:hypothetical protein [Blastocatellia bacterium]
MGSTLWVHSADESSATLYIDFEDDEIQVPCFSYSRPWELWHAPGAAEFEITCDGFLNICRDDAAPDERTLYARIEIQTFVELKEAAEAFLNPVSPGASSAVFEAVDMNRFVESIYFPVSVRASVQPDGPSWRPARELRLADWSDVSALFPNTDVRAKTLAALAGKKPQEGDAVDDYWNYDERHINAEDPRLINWDSRDVVICAETGLASPAEVYEAGGPEFGFVLRLKEKASLLFVLDVLRYSLDAKNLRTELRSASSWNDWLKTKTISAPRDRLLQIYHSIAFRNARRSYIDEVNTLPHVYEPLDEAPAMLRRREEAVRSIHQGILLQVESVVRPLPFFIEYPYALFIGTADRAQKIRHAQMILNVLCKALLLLPLEELQHNGRVSESLENLMAKVREGRSSDGKLLGFGRDLRKIVRAESLSSQLSLFRDLSGNIGEMIAEQLGTMVTARNRAHHPPFDEKGYLEVAGANLPKMVHQLRDVFQDTKMIVPRAVRPSRDRTTVAAMKAMGENPAFRSFEFQTTLPAGDFIVDELVAYRAAAPEILVPLNHWFEAKAFSSESIDVGLFERMEREGPAFSYIAH